METTEAFNYIKKIINEGKKNNKDYKLIQWDISQYLDILIDEKQITKKQNTLLSCVLGRMKDIVANKITADEVFVKALSKRENSKYVTCNMHKYIDGSDSKKQQEKKQEEDKPKVKVKTRKENHGNPWDYLPVEPGTCGKSWDAQRKAQWDKMWNSPVKEKTGCGRYWD